MHLVSVSVRQTRKFLPKPRYTHLCQVFKTRFECRTSQALYLFPDKANITQNLTVIFRSEALEGFDSREVCMEYRVLGYHCRGMYFI